MCLGLFYCAFAGPLTHSRVAAHVRNSLRFALALDAQTPSPFSAESLRSKALSGHEDWLSAEILICGDTPPQAGHRRAFIQKPGCVKRLGFSISAFAEPLTHLRVAAPARSVLRFALALYAQSPSRSFSLRLRKGRDVDGDWPSVAGLVHEIRPLQTDHRRAWRVSGAFA